MGALWLERDFLRPMSRFKELLVIVWLIIVGWAFTYLLVVRLTQIGMNEEELRFWEGNNSENIEWIEE